MAVTVLHYHQGWHRACGPLCSQQQGSHAHPSGSGTSYTACSRACRTDPPRQQMRLEETQSRGAQTGLCSHGWHAEPHSSQAGNVGPWEHHCLCAREHVPRQGSPRLWNQDSQVPPLALPSQPPAFPGGFCHPSASRVAHIRRFFFLNPMLLLPLSTPPLHMKPTPSSPACHTTAANASRPGVLAGEWEVAGCPARGIRQQHLNLFSATTCRVSVAKCCRLLCLGFLLLPRQEAVTALKCFGRTGKRRALSLSLV